MILEGFKDTDGDVVIKKNKSLLEEAISTK